ncbi:MAG: sulfotransferase domain-containing protein [Proteobacteria bacterium]|nr:sulfotransferase domain-containing protein [Pseudomonadota bacterium]
MSSVSVTGPNLFLVGAPKCGTTSLYEYLRRHPQIFFPVGDDSTYSLVKEPQHFCADLEIGPRCAIHDRSDYLNLYRDAGESRWLGDASTYYLFSPTASAAIRQFNPDARILIMLRPPFEMMRSYHSELLRWGLEDIIDFHEAVSAWTDRSEGRRLPKDLTVAKCLDYIAIGRFAPQIERYLDTFGRDAVKIVLLEDLSAHPVQTWRGILEFLDTDASFQPEFRVYNEAPVDGTLEHLLHVVHGLPGVRQLSNAIFPYATRRRLVAALRRQQRGRSEPDPRDLELRKCCEPDITRLAQLIGRDLSHWM